MLDGVNVASLALMAAVTLQLGRAAIVDVPTAILAAVGAVVLIRYRPQHSVARARRRARRDRDLVRPRGDRAIVTIAGIPV